ncbi:redoxin family protein [Robiginitomaculum antarcticum]|uniref:redoxin family protein n=1 Tax=Robiginitomaculum antarcticum TaxID=437507 RepID=UPI0003648C6B|nr:redoxin family protein [Robiginitomaculum antarcticum]
MIRRTLLALTAASAIAISIPALAAVKTGDAAPGFTAVDSNGVSHSLSDFAGKTVVLEWTNDGCPYVKKHYNSGNMQKIQKDATDNGVVWLTVISSAPGKQGYVDGAGANTLTENYGAFPTAVLLDPAGDLGRMYDAKTTPHMYVINAAGNLVYQGAIDSNRSSDPATIPAATNYVLAALDAVENGETPQTMQSEAYGCSVKY